MVHSGVGLCIVQGELQTGTTMNEGQWQGYVLAHHHAICEKPIVKHNSFTSTHRYTGIYYVNQKL